MSQPVATPKVSPRAGSKRLLPHFLVVIGLLSLGLAVVFYSQASPASPNSATSQLRSAGIGLTKSEWESQHQFARIDTVEYRRYIYDYKETLYKQIPSDEGTIWSTGYYVTYWADPQSEITQHARIRTIYVETPILMLQSELGISLNEAIPEARWREFIQQLMPSDTKLVTTHKSREYVKEVYYSEALASHYSPLPSAPNHWRSEPGRINLIHFGVGSSFQVEADLVYVYPPTPTPEPYFTPTRPIIPTSLATRVWIPRPVPSNMPAPQPTQGKSD
jgi:hypothetical protein